MELDTSQNAHPQSISTLGVCTARYESKCSPSKYPETWCLWSSIRGKNAHPQSISTLGVCTARYESKCSPSKYLETWRLYSSIQVKMLNLKVSRHLASVELDTSQNAHPQSISTLGVCTARYESKCSPSKYLETWRLWSSIRVKMLTLKVFRHESKYPDTRASVELDTSQNAHPQSISTLGVCTARYESKCSPSKYPETWCLWSSIRVKMLTLKVFRHLASVQLDTSQNAHPQSILKLGVCTARYKSKCSTSKYPDTWRLWSWIRVKMLTLKVSQHLASVQLDTSQNAHPQSILKLGVCGARYE